MPGQFGKSQRISEAEVAQIQAMVDANPTFQAALKDPRAQDRYGVQFLYDAARKAGIDLPDSYMVDTGGRVRFNDEEDWLKWMIPATAAATAGTASMLSAGPATTSLAQAGANAGTKAIASTSDAVTPVFGADGLPTLPSNDYGTGMAHLPPSIPTSPNTGGMEWDGVLKKWVQKGANSLMGAGGDGTPDWLRAAMAAMAGLPGVLGNQGPSDEERGYQAQATRLLGQQEQRTQFQNPLYEAVTKMAHGLLPNMGNNGQPYPLNGLSDVKVPTMEELIAKQRRA